MSIKDEITRISNAKSSLANEIKKMGVSIPSGTTLDQYASLLAAGINNLIGVKEIQLGTAWSAGEQTVSLNGITANSSPVLDVKLSHLPDENTRLTHEEEWNKIMYATTSINSITFYLKRAAEPTTTNITVLVKGV